MQMKTIQDINFQQLWENARSQRTWSSKDAKDWDKKAESFAQRNINGHFSRLLVEKLQLQASDTVLDVGSGPGTLSLPVAEKTRHVTAVDYSEKMLALLEQHAQQKNLTNISTIQASWTDDWEQKGIVPHDIGIASRSLNVVDLKGALQKLNDYSKKYVFLADRINPTPLDPKVFEAIGRTFESGPDYIYTINILYELNIHPQVEILELERTVTFDNFDRAYESLKWMVKQVTEEEEKLLRNYLYENSHQHTDGTVTFKRSHPLQWAIIWWKTGDGK